MKGTHDLGYTQEALITEIGFLLREQLYKHEHSFLPLID